MDTKQGLLEYLRLGRPLALRQQILLALQLSTPAILSQLSTITMQYIDTAMVGSLGPNSSASIGMVSSSTWLIMGLCRAVEVGFSVLVAQCIGAGDEKKARGITNQGVVVGLLLGLLIGGICVAISGPLPLLLHANDDIAGDASIYFLIYGLSVPFIMLNRLTGALLQASGNMKTPSRLLIIMCFLDVIFNQFFIFSTHKVWIFTIPGAGLGVAGASLGTALSEVVCASIMTYYLLVRSPALHVRREEGLHFVPSQIRQAVRLGIPVALERVAMCSAQVLTTGLVAPLGTAVIAANSFAVTAEGLCYMPGYGIQGAAVTIIGQSVGAKRKDLINRLGWLTVLLGMSTMGLAALIIFITAPLLIGLMCPDQEVVNLGVAMLRIVVFAEPFFGAAIVASGVFQGAGKSFIGSVLSLASMWGVRVPLLYCVVPKSGLRGVWVVMAIELCFRGLIFLLFLWRKWWIPSNLRSKKAKIQS